MKKPKKRFKIPIEIKWEGYGDWIIEAESEQVALELLYRGEWRRGDIQCHDREIIEVDLDDEGGIEELG